MNNDLLRAFFKLHKFLRFVTKLYCVFSHPYMRCLSCALTVVLARHVQPTDIISLKSYLRKFLSLLNIFYCSFISLARRKIRVETSCCSSACLQERKVHLTTNWKFCKLYLEGQQTMAFLSFNGTPKVT